VAGADRVLPFSRIVGLQSTAIGLRLKLSVSRLRHLNLMTLLRASTRERGHEHYPQARPAIIHVVKQKHEPGPPMTLGNMSELGVLHLIGYCHSDARRHQALIDVSDCPDDVEITWFQRRANCSKCGGKRVEALRCATRGQRIVCRLHKHGVQLTPPYAHVAAVENR
jgi:hypothetical protein